MYINKSFSLYYQPLIIDIHNEFFFKHYYFEINFNTITLRERKYKNYNKRKIKYSFNPLQRYSYFKVKN